MASAFPWAANTLDLAVAWYIDEHILDGYRFLMEYYHSGDRVYLFGFSRGSYIARALANMLHKVGLLAMENTAQVARAYRLYVSDCQEAMEYFKEFFCCRQVPIGFLGVWDTVSSTGLLLNRSLPFVQGNSSIRVFRQALALDEHRVKFIPHYHQHQTPEGTAVETDAKEVWFVGSHTDVGGGVKNVTPTLSNISLRWMIREMANADVHIAFNRRVFNELRIPDCYGLTFSERFDMPE